MTDILYDYISHITRRKSGVWSGGPIAATYLCVTSPVPRLEAAQQIATSKASSYWTLLDCWVKSSSNYILLTKSAKRMVLVIVV